MSTLQDERRSVPWVDKYRPSKLEYIVHQTELMKTLKNILKSGDMPHLLFYGPPGSGKTTTILALANELFGSHKFKERVLELNASDERGINVVRNDITVFAKTKIGDPSPNFTCPQFKILILDEADAMTPEAQSALRIVMEETSAGTRFCLICNYVDKIIVPIISRCMQFRFMAISQKTMKERLMFIAKKEKMSLSEDIFDTITEVVDGDLRKGIMLLQNAKYISFGGNIQTNDIYNLVGHVPKQYVTDIVRQCKKKENSMIPIAKKFHSSGYSVVNLCEQMCQIIIKDDNISDEIKNNIFKTLASVCDKLNDGSSEFIQLVKLLSIVNDFLHK